MAVNVTKLSMVAEGLFYFAAFGFCVLSTFDLVSSAEGTACNVPNASKVETLFEYSAFSADDPLVLVGAAIDDKTLALATSTSATGSKGGVNGYAFFAGNGESDGHVEEENEYRFRVADGFISKFRVRVLGPADGFTFFVNRMAMYNLNGGTGANLGVAGVQPRLAFKFDVCADRPSNPTDLRACTEETFSRERERVRDHHYPHFGCHVYACKLGIHSGWQLSRRRSAILG